MKKLFIIALLLMAAVLINAQEVGQQDPSLMSIDAADQELREVSVDNFDHEGFWRSSMSSDEGYITSRLISSKGHAKTDREKEEDAANNLEYETNSVLGARVDYLRRGYSSFTLYPTRPIPIEGITKVVSVWVAGRNFNHTLKLLIQDYYGRNFEVNFDKTLKFMGWEKLTATIRPDSGIVQMNPHFFNKLGIKIMGFRVECDPMETYGSYYIYFNDLRAVTDLFAENNPDKDDVPDGW
jgi:hypothetical protein